ncbi:MAG: hypothetical protein Q8876_04960 [Bacillota bacterium]|nr:hypothetical protein [Bacillota bacterium]
MELPKRKPNRLKGYDYSQNGAYFITVCVKNREKLLHNVGARIARPINEDNLSEYGLIVKTAIEKISVNYLSVTVDKYVIMPDHIHLILIINSDNNKCAICNDNGREMCNENYEHGMRDENSVQEMQIKNSGCAMCFENDGCTMCFEDDGRVMRSEINGQMHSEINGRAMRAPTISTVINQMKGYVTKQIGFSMWQKLFYDHIIRNENEYQKIWQYIDTNPLKLEKD